MPGDQGIEKSLGWNIMQPLRMTNMKTMWQHKLFMEE